MISHILRNAPEKTTAQGDWSWIRGMQKIFTRGVDTHCFIATSHPILLFKDCAVSEVICELSIDHCNLVVVQCIFEKLHRFDYALVSSGYRQKRIFINPNRERDRSLGTTAQVHISPWIDYVPTQGI